MIRRLIILQIILLAGLSSIWLLPKTPPIQPAALKLNERKPDDNAKLPDRLTLTGWKSTGEMTREGTPQEKAALAKDTEFYRRQYRRELSSLEQPRNANVLVLDELNTSIVLSGKELTGSIHALERCLNAQGFNILSSSTMKITLRGEGKDRVLPVRRLLCEKVDPAHPAQVQRSISYFWFVGHDSVTSNHIKRGLKDFWDRIMKGYDQRWAYITITANLNGGYIYQEPKPGEQRKGDEPLPKLIDVESGREIVRRPLEPGTADEIVNDFIADFAPDVMQVDKIEEWPDE